MPDGCLYIRNRDLELLRDVQRSRSRNRRVILADQVSHVGSRPTRGGTISIPVSFVKRNFMLPEGVSLPKGESLRALSPVGAGWRSTSNPGSERTLSGFYPQTEFPEKEYPTRNHLQTGRFRLFRFFPQPKGPEFGAWAETRGFTAASTSNANENNTRYQHQRRSGRRKRTRHQEPPHARRGGASPSPREAVRVQRAPARRSRGRHRTRSRHGDRKGRRPIRPRHRDVLDVRLAHRGTQARRHAPAARPRARHRGEPAGRGRLRRGRERPDPPRRRHSRRERRTRAPRTMPLGPRSRGDDARHGARRLRAHHARRDDARHTPGAQHPEMELLWRSTGHTTPPKRKNGM